MKKITLFLLMVLGGACAAADLIPGLATREVKSAFAELGLPEAEVRYTPEQTEQNMRATIDGNLFMLGIFGPPHDSTGMLAMSVMVQNQTLELNQTNELSLSFLCLAASMPYAGSMPAEARIWIAANLGKKAEKMFGPVKLQLMGEGRTRILRMSMEPLTPVAAENTLPTITHLDREVRAKSGRIPSIGTSYTNVELEHGKPAVKDPDTGWATWPTFKALFEDGKAVEVITRQTAP